MKIVIDMLAGDNGINGTKEATLTFIKKHSDVELFLVGDEKLLTEFKEFKNVNIVHATKVLPMDIDPLAALKDKESTLMVAVQTFLDNKCDGFVSAGTTGGLLSAATFKIKRLKGVKRPGLITSFPSYVKNKKFVVIDLGANNQNTKEELVQFAVMGSIYYKNLYKKENPEVYLLSNGTEEEKGSPLNKEVYPLLAAQKNINFKGNIEARDPLYGKCDVLVTDGYSGNIYLKSTEGACKVMSSLIKDAFKRNIFSKIGYLLTKKGVEEMKERMDYKNVGGALLAGVNGVVIKAHGNSDFKGFLSALEAAHTLITANIVKEIEEGI